MIHSPVLRINSEAVTGASLHLGLLGSLESSRQFVNVDGQNPSVVSSSSSSSSSHTPAASQSARKPSKPSSTSLSKPASVASSLSAHGGDRKHSADATCDEGHPLNKFTTYNRNFSCDRCKKKIRMGATAFSCRPLCNYDVCSPCLSNDGGDADPGMPSSSALRAPSSSEGKHSSGTKRKQASSAHATKEPKRKKKGD